jgi:hypothetical protein
MSLHWCMKPGCCALGTALALAATAALANPVASPTLVPQTSMQVAVADSTETVAQVSGSTLRRSFPPSEAGVRRAAAQGPEALRRYIWRTRMIYNYYFWNFVKQE